MNQKTDVESGWSTSPTYLMVLLEGPELPWAFVRNVYWIVAIQLLITIAVATVVNAVEPISVFFTTTYIGFALYIGVVLTPLIVLWSLAYHYKRHPVNYFLLAIFTVALAFAVGLACAFTNGNLILGAAILPAGLVAILTLSAFCSARRGHYFDFQVHFWSGVTLVFILFLVIQMNQKTDVESGWSTSPTYLMVLLEGPELPWAFVRNVYWIVAVQLLITIAVATVVNAVEPISVFFTTTYIGFALYIGVVLTPLIVLWSLAYHYKRHPVNYFLLAIFTVALAFAVGLTCAFTNGNLILGAAILPAGLVAILTLSAFCSARRGHYFDFQVHFWSGVTLVFILFLVIQIIFFEFSPPGQISYMSSVFVIQSYSVSMLHMIQTT